MGDKIRYSIYLSSEENLKLKYVMKKLGVSKPQDVYRELVKERVELEESKEMAKKVREMYKKLIEDDE